MQDPKLGSPANGTTHWTPNSGQPHKARRGSIGGSVIGLLVMVVAAALIGVPEARQLRDRLRQNRQGPQGGQPRESSDTPVRSNDRD